MSYATRAKLANLTRVSPQSRSLLSTSFQTFCLSVLAYLNTQKYGLFCSLEFLRPISGSKIILKDNIHTVPEKFFNGRNSFFNVFRSRGTKLTVRKFESLAVEKFER